MSRICNEKFYQRKLTYKEWNDMGLLSVVVPCYNEEPVLKMFYERITEIAMQMQTQYKLEFEFIFVNDGSKDKTLEVMHCLAQQDKRVKYISFSRNFGKEAGLLAGLKAAKGDYVTVMDADLQDPPEFLVQMYEKITAGEADCVAARRMTRKGEPPIRSFFARMFYKGINRISQTEIVDGARDFRLMTRQMVNAIVEMSEYNRFSKGIFSWVGFRTEWIPYTNVERAAGNTSWSFWGLLLYAIDGILAFSTAPLMFVTVLGLLFALIAFIMIIVVIVKTLLWGEPVAGYPSLVCIIFLVAGVQTMCLAIVGQYLAKAYLEVKKRPAYIVKETNIESEEIV